MRAAKVQARLRIRAVSPEPLLLAHTSSESKGTFRQKARSQAPLSGWACAVTICHDGMLEDTNSLDAAQLVLRVKLKEENETKSALSCLNAFSTRSDMLPFPCKVSCVIYSILTMDLPQIQYILNKIPKAT